MSDIWTTLGLSPIRDRDAIRRAYARRLKVTNPEDDAEAFRELRAAYEHALASLDWDWEWEDEADGDATSEPLSPLRVEVSPVTTTVLEERPGDNAQTVERSAHLDRLARLEALFETSEAPARAEIEPALAELLASSGLDDVALHAQTEERLIQLILDRMPASDPLVRPVINAFGWKRTGVASRHDSRVEAVLDRDADIIFRDGLAPGTALHAAYRHLTHPHEGPPGWRARLSPTLEDKVSQLLREIDVRRPSLETDLDPTALAWWRERLSKPRLPAWSGWTVVALPLLAGLIAFLASSGNGLQALGAWAATQAATLAVAALYVFGFLRPRHIWATNWSWRAPMWARVAWGPACLALVLLSALLPQHPVSLAAVTVLSIGILWWSLITGHADTGQGGYPWPVRMLMTQAYLIGWWLVLLFAFPGVIAPQLLVATAVAMIIAMTGNGALLEVWHGELSRPVRLAGLAVLVMLSGLATYQMLHWLDAGDHEIFPSVAVALVTVVVLGQRPAMAALGLTAFKARHYLMWFSLIGLRLVATSVEGGLTAIGGLWLLMGFGIGLVGVLAEERRA